MAEQRRTLGGIQVRPRLARREDPSAVVRWIRVAAWVVAYSGESAARHVEYVCNRREEAALCDVLREVVGNPFRRVAVDPGWLAWGRGAVPRIARSIYDAKDWGRLPALAEALEAAGCAEAALLDHLRGLGPHVRGCFALDACLGRS